MKLKDKANFQFGGQAGKILENANYHFLASVALTKEKQAFQRQEDVDLLGEVGCPGSTQFCSTCAAVHRPIQQPCHTAALPAPDKPQYPGNQGGQEAPGLLVCQRFIPCPSHSEGQENFQNLAFFSRMLYYFRLSLLIFSYLCKN